MELSIKCQGTTSTGNPQLFDKYRKIKLLRYAQKNYQIHFWVKSYINLYYRFIDTHEIDLVVKHYNNTNGVFPTMILKKYEDVTFYAIKIGDFIHRVYSYTGDDTFRECAHY